MFAGRLSDSIEIDSAAVVTDRNVNAAGFTESCQLHSASGGFSSGRSLLRAFNSVADRVAHQVQEWLSYHVGEGLVDAYFAAGDLELNLFTELARRDAAGSRGCTLENFSARYQPKLNQPLFKFNKSSSQTRITSFALIRERCVKGRQRPVGFAKQLAGIRNEFIEPSQFDLYRSDRTLSGRSPKPRRGRSGLSGGDNRRLNP